VRQILPRRTPKLESELIHAFFAGISRIDTLVRIDLAHARTSWNVTRAIGAMKTARRQVRAKTPARRSAAIDLRIVSQRPEQVNEIPFGCASPIL
jgi:hypothetical protein